MNNLPLKALVWIEISEKVRNDPSICELDKGALWIADDNLIFRYNIKNNPNSKELPFIVNYGGRQPKEVDSVEYGKHWAEHTHYASQMQPYVKPMPTWIDYGVQKPTEKGSYLIRDHQGRLTVGKFDNFFYMDYGGENWGIVSHWMPIPEFSTMQNMHKGGVIVNGFKLCTNCGKKRFMDPDKYHPMDGKGVCHECQLKSEADND